MEKGGRQKPTAPLGFLFCQHKRTVPCLLNFATQRTVPCVLSPVFLEPSPVLFCQDTEPSPVFVSLSYTSNAISECKAYTNTLSVWVPAVSSQYLRLGFISTSVPSFSYDTVYVVPRRLPPQCSSVTLKFVSTTTYVLFCRSLLICKIDDMVSYNAPITILVMSKVKKRPRVCRLLCCYFASYLDIP